MRNGCARILQVMPYHGRAVISRSGIEEVQRALIYLHTPVYQLYITMYIYIYIQIKWHSYSTINQYIKYIYILYDTHILTLQYIKYLYICIYVWWITHYASIKMWKGIVPNNWYYFILLISLTGNVILLKSPHLTGGATCGLPLLHWVSKSVSRTRWYRG